MRLVKHIHLVLPSGRRHFDFIAQITNVIDTAIGGRIDLNDVKGIARGNLTALLAHVTWLTIDGGTAIDRFRQEAGDTGFTCTPRSRKEIGMSKFAAGKGSFKRANDGFLTDEL